MTHADPSGGKGSELTHLDDQGRARMVDVGGKPVTKRMASAEGFITMSSALMAKMAHLKKGNAFEIARLAGIMAAKKTSDLIPLCHPLMLNKVAVALEPQPEVGRVRVFAEVHCHGRTGVEMEALTAVNVALLTLYDMGKALERAMTFQDIRLVEKSGGESGHYLREST